MTGADLNEVLILNSLQETSQLLPGQDLPAVTDFSSAIFAFERLLGSLEHFTIHSTTKTVDYCGKKYRYIDIRDLSGSSVLKVVDFKERLAKHQGFRLKKPQQVVLDCFDRPVLHAVEFHRYNPTSEILLLAGTDHLGFVTNPFGALSTSIKLKVKTKSKSDKLPDVPTTEVGVKVTGYAGCFCCCYNCGTNKPGGVRFHPKYVIQGEPGIQEEVEDLLADMESLSKAEYTNMLPRNGDPNSVNFADDLKRGIAQLHIKPTVPVLFKIWILFVSAFVFQTSFKKIPCCGCCFFRYRIKWCLATLLVLLFPVSLLIVNLERLYHKIRDFRED